MIISPLVVFFGNNDIPMSKFLRITYLTRSHSTLDVPFEAETDLPVGHANGCSTAFPTLALLQHLELKFAYSLLLAFILWRLTLWTLCLLWFLFYQLFFIFPKITVQAKSLSYVFHCYSNIEMESENSAKEGSELASATLIRLRQVLFTAFPFCCYFMVSHVIWV